MERGDAVTAKKAKAAILQDPEKEFTNIFQKLCYSRQSWEVWSDMVGLFARSYANFAESAAIADPEQRSDTWKRREKEYLQIIGKYTKDEQQLFPQLHALMVMELDKRRADFLGDMYMKLNLGSHWHGQFFTPASVATMMARITATKEVLLADIEKKGYATLCDPACGAGVNLLAAMDCMAQEGINFQERALFTGQDIDSVAGLMCYIQLSAFGCAGYVCIGNTLTNPMGGEDVLLPVERPEQEFWFTPTWYSNIWQGRRVARRMDRILKGIPKMKQKKFIFDFEKGNVRYG